MGLRLIGSNSSYDNYRPVGAPRSAGNSDREIINDLYNQLPNPNPKNYKIKRSRFSCGNLLVEVNYPDCTNYEGNKILLYRKTTLKQLKRQKHIDPHFARSKKFKSPVARFEPTKLGWRMGLVMLRKI